MLVKRLGLDAQSCSLRLDGVRPRLVACQLCPVRGPGCRLTSRQPRLSGGLYRAMMLKDLLSATFCPHLCHCRWGMTGGQGVNQVRVILWSRLASGGGPGWGVGGAGGGRGYSTRVLGG